MTPKLQDFLLLGVKVDNSVHNYGAGKLTTSEHFSRPIVTIIAALCAIIFCFLTFYFRNNIRDVLRKAKKAEPRVRYSAPKQMHINMPTTATT
jgi:hypothetical protein